MLFSNWKKFSTWLGWVCKPHHTHHHRSELAAPVGAYGLSILAGGVTVSNPCVLPLLPIILATSLRDSRYGPMAFTAGLVLLSPFSALA